MFPRIPRVLVDSKVVSGAEVQAIVVKTTLGHSDLAEVTVASALQTPPSTYSMGANLEVRLALGDMIFAGRIMGIQPAPQSGFRQWVIRGHAPWRFAQPRVANDVRIAGPIKSMTVSRRASDHNSTFDHVVLGIGKRPEPIPEGRATVTLDPEVDSVKFLLGDTKEISAGGYSFTGRITNIERRYVQAGANQMTLVVVGVLPESSPR